MTGQREPSLIEEAAEAYRKRLKFERMQPLGPLVHPRQIHVMRGEGDGLTVYLGRHRGAGFVGVHLRGFTGWRSHPAWMPGGWEYMNPMLIVGRLGSNSEARCWTCEVLVPSKLYWAWRWISSPSWRKAMREMPEEAEA